MTRLNGIDPSKPLPQRSATKYNLNFWIELYNPFRPNLTGNYPTNQGKVDLSKYQILITRPNNKLGDDNPENVTGAPDGTILSTVTFQPNTWVQPASNNGIAYSGATTSNQGFFVVGPDTTALFL